MTTNYQRRKLRTKNNVVSNNKSGRPRITVSRKNKNIYTQLIDAVGNVLVSFSSLNIKSDSPLTGIEKAKLVGKNFATICLQRGFELAVFDKGPYIYNGRIKALAESCREHGLKF
jgi:large subunit ribosomal protein L18